MTRLSYCLHAVNRSFGGGHSGRNGRCKKAYTALIDLGTNGEIVVGNKDRIVCASTAAGPAFEGMNISMGMRAVTGAISSVNTEDGKIKVAVIGNTQPKGICGSGLIDAVAVFRESGLIGTFGEITSGEESLRVAGRVTLTQKDINEFQLAKAAVAAGLRILTEELSTDICQEERYTLPAVLALPESPTCSGDGDDRNGRGKDSYDGQYGLIEQNVFVRKRKIN